MLTEPICTYRLQLRPGFGFNEVLEIIEYLSQLGISHLYLSPYLQAAKDSTHGYDIVDPSKINQQLGDEKLHKKLCEEVKSRGLKLLLDIVPNHMAIVAMQNPWWWDVLENGFSSLFASYFDVDWEASEERWPNKILLPVLEDHYGRILEKGLLTLVFLEGQFVLQYKEQSFPIDPSSSYSLLNRASKSIQNNMLGFLAESFSRLPRPTVTARPLIEMRHRDIGILKSLLQNLCLENHLINEAIELETSLLNKDVEALDALIEKQNYRLAFWRTASRDLGYRRFFDIKDLAGLRIEDLEVFDAVHYLPIKWYKQGFVDGFRVDHPDGLRQPRQYFNRLHQKCPDAWIVAEKILVPGENLPADWLVDGTTGYDFLNLLNELFIFKDGEKELTKIYIEFSQENLDFYDIVYTAKYQVLNELFGSEVHRLTNLFVFICETNLRYRDYTRYELREALCQTAACFPVYRTYVSASDSVFSKEDEAVIDMAIKRAVEKNPSLDVELFHFLKDILLLKIKGPYESELVMCFQQLTGPVMAKGYEDTALYRYNRLIALNEVGSDPSCFGISLDHFHKKCIEAQEKMPYSLLASTTHDTKHSEDFRARLALISQIPDQFAVTLKRLSSIVSDGLKIVLSDKNSEYLFYQMLIGAWPIDKERAKAFMIKAAREAKQKTSWAKPNKEYEELLQKFIELCLENQSFTDEINSFAKKLIIPGWLASLSQTVIKLTVPGIADIYQGSELWNLTLVDPDNRQAVDYVKRQKLLTDMQNLPLKDVLKEINEGAPKLWIIAKILHFRKKSPELFGAQASYMPLYAEGEHSSHVIAFMRGNRMVTLASRFQLNKQHGWAKTSINLPAGAWQNIFTDEIFESEENKKYWLADIFSLDISVALLVKIA